MHSRRGRVHDVLKGGQVNVVLRSQRPEPVRRSLHRLLHAFHRTRRVQLAVHDAYRPRSDHRQCHGRIQQLQHPRSQPPPHLICHVRVHLARPHVLLRLLCHLLQDAVLIVLCGQCQVEVPSGPGAPNVLLPHVVAQPPLDAQQPHHGRGAGDAHVHRGQHRGLQRPQPNPGDSHAARVDVRAQLKQVKQHHQVPHRVQSVHRRARA
mmetsp:Transcript_8686/g.16456  ORF Transcript_8686/g.16456 Transcript_8686/m.16456 type:complete len:207 (+) Transcript_8686:391-1011(+)